LWHLPMNGSSYSVFINENQVSLLHAWSSNSVSLCLSVSLWKQNPISSTLFCVAIAAAAIS
jgi:hypothetical protein